MRFIFKTTYRQDLRLFRDHFQRNWYLALVAGLLVLPILLPDYLVDFSLVLIFGLCALSLMVLAGYTGLVSLGHAAFLGIGAYAHVYFSQDMGLPWIASVALAAGIAAVAGILVGLPALRMTGIYLTIATLAAALASKSHHAFEMGSIDLTMWACIAPAQAVAAWFGARVAPLVSAEQLSRVFAIALAVTGFTMLHSSLA